MSFIDERILSKKLIEDISCLDKSRNTFTVCRESIKYERLKLCLKIRGRGNYCDILSSNIVSLYVFHMGQWEILIIYRPFGYRKYLDPAHDFFTSDRAFEIFCRDYFHLIKVSSFFHESREYDIHLSASHVESWSKISSISEHESEFTHPVRCRSERSIKTIFIEESTRTIIERREFIAIVQERNCREYHLCGFLTRDRVIWSEEETCWHRSDAVLIGIRIRVGFIWTKTRKPLTGLSISLHDWTIRTIAHFEGTNARLIRAKMRKPCTGLHVSRHHTSIRAETRFLRTHALCVTCARRHDDCTSCVGFTRICICLEREVLWTGKTGGTCPLKRSTHRYILVSTWWWCVTWSRKENDRTPQSSLTAIWIGPCGSSIWGTELSRTLARSTRRDDSTYRSILCGTRSSCISSSRAFSSIVCPFLADDPIWEHTFSHERTIRARSWNGSTTSIETVECRRIRKCNTLGNIRENYSDYQERENETRMHRKNEKL